MQRQGLDGAVSSAQEHEQGGTDDDEGDDEDDHEKGGEAPGAARNRCDSDIDLGNNRQSEEGVPHAASDLMPCLQGNTLGSSWNDPGGSGDFELTLKRFPLTQWFDGEIKIDGNTALSDLIKNRTLPSGRVGCIHK